MGLGVLKDIGRGAVKFGKGAVHKAKDAGGSALGKAKHIGGEALETAKDVGGSALNKAKRVGGQALDTAKDVGKDAVHFSQEALEWRAKQEKNFAHGVLEWGKGSVDTVVGIATHPVATLKATTKLALNPLLNPVVGVPAALAQGKNPVEAYKEGAGQLKDIGTGLIGGYKDVYKKYGVAGLAGNLAPDVAIAVLSGGSGAAAKGAGTGAAKAVAGEVAEEVAQSTLRQTVKTTGKDIAKEFIPGPTDIADQARRQDNPKTSSNSLVDSIFNSLHEFLG